jgi:hypothetical protein
MFSELLKLVASIYNLKNHFLANHAIKASSFETIVILVIIKSI